MKKAIIIFAVLSIFVIVLGAMSGVIRTSEPGDTIVTNDVEVSTDNSIVSGEVNTDVVKYSYDVKIYKSGTSTQLGTLKFDSASETVSVRIAGNSLVFEANDKVQPIQFTDYKSIDTVSPGVITPGASIVYITYTIKTPTHTHSYTPDDNATCTEAGTKSCTCGATVTMAALGHEAENIRLESCNDVAYCIRCGIPMKSGPCVDTDGDGYCDASPDGHKVH